MNGDRLKVGKDFAGDEWTAKAAAGCKQDSEVLRKLKKFGIQVICLVLFVVFSTSVRAY